MKTTAVVTLFLVLAVAATASARRRKPYSSSGASSSSEESIEPGPAVMLSPLLEAGLVTEAQNASRVDPPLLGDLESYSGFLTVDKERNSNLFFWFFPADKGMEDAPVVLWLQGGPGSSGLLGVFLENGPVKLRKGRRLKRRRHSWTRVASMLYVDSPVGTGFSFTDDPEGLATSSEQVGRHLHTALLQFFKLFPQLQGNEFFIAGESYAGKYAPALAMAIHTANNASNKVNLKGLALGNPLADPESMLEYGDYLYQLGLVDEHGRRLFREREDHIRALLEQRRWTDAWRERDALIGKSVCGGGDSNGTLFSDLTGFRYRFNYLHDMDYLQRGYKTFVQSASVRQLLHVGNLTYHNRSAVAERLRPDVMQSARGLYEQLLAANYPVLFYNGQLDVADPYPLMVNFLRRLNWAAAAEYRVAERRLWMVDGELAGYAKTAGTLTEVLVRAAGHMVPTDQPKWALDLITKFVSHKPIVS